MVLWENSLKVQEYMCIVLILDYIFSFPVQFEVLKLQCLKFKNVLTKILDIF